MISSSRLYEWWRFGTGWLWLARALYVAGAVNFILYLWMFLSSSLSWLPFFFMSVTAFAAAALIKRRSVTIPAADSTRWRGKVATQDAARALGAAEPPPAPMFDREGRTPLERVMRDDGEDAK